jgi:hypothetical protein
MLYRIASPSVIERIFTATRIAVVSVKVQSADESGGWTRYEVSCLDWPGRGSYELAKALSGLNDNARRNGLYFGRIELEVRRRDKRTVQFLVSFDARFTKPA